jgi:phage portal protein BeeE
MRLLDAIAQRYGSQYNEYQYSEAQYVTYSYSEGKNREGPIPITSQATKAYNENGVVFAAILARMSLFSEVKFVFQSKDDGKLDNLPPRAQILENPWPNGTTSELLSRMVQDADLAGNAYFWNTGDGQLSRLPPDEVTIVSEEVKDNFGRTYRKLVGYWWDPDKMASNELGPGERAEFYAHDEVVHWSPIPDPRATFRGMSWLTPVLREIGSDSSLTEYKIKYLENAATPNILIKYKQKLQKETIDSLASRMQARFGGVGNAFKTLILDQGADTTVVGNSLEQMNFTTVQAAGENRILMASGVPGIVVGAKEGLQAATYSNYKQAMRRFADVTVDPMWVSVCSCLSGVVQVPEHSRLWFDKRNIAALQDDEVERANSIVIKAQAIAHLTQFGYAPDSVVDAVETGDLTLLKHPGPPIDLKGGSLPLAKPPAVKYDPATGEQIAAPAKTPAATPAESNGKVNGPVRNVTGINQELASISKEREGLEASLKDNLRVEIQLLVQSKLEELDQRERELKEALSGELYYRVPVAAINGKTK